MRREPPVILHELIDIPSADLIFPEAGPETIYILPEVISPFKTVDIPALSYFSFKDVAAYPPAPAALPVPVLIPGGPADEAAVVSDTGPEEDGVPAVIKQPEKQTLPASTPRSASPKTASTDPGAAPVSARVIPKAGFAAAPGSAAAVPQGRTERAIVSLPGQAGLSSKSENPVPVPAPVPAVPDGLSVIYETAGIIEIVLDRPGWIFAGEKSGKKGISFESRQVIDDKTLFKFRIMEEGDYKIVFQLQDMSGKADISEVNVKQISSSSPESSSAGSGITVGKEKDSIINPGAAETGSLPENILSEAVSSADGGNYIMAIELLEMIVKDNPAWPELDKIYYLLGRYYEADTSRRSAAKSVFYYEKIIEDFPLSDYIHEAEDKIKYLRKHFIHIR